VQGGSNKAKHLPQKNAVYFELGWKLWEILQSTTAGYFLSKKEAKIECQCRFFYVEGMENWIRRASWLSRLFLWVTALYGQVKIIIWKWVFGYFLLSTRP